MTRPPSSFDAKRRALFMGLRSTPTEDDPVVPVLGIWQSDSHSTQSGRIGVFGDSACLDSSLTPSKSDCFWLMKSLLEFATTAKVGEPLASSLQPASSAPLPMDSPESPKSMADSRFEQFSRVIKRGAAGNQQRSVLYHPLRACLAAPPRALVAPVDITRDLLVHLLSSPSAL